MTGKERLSLGGQITEEGKKHLGRVAIFIISIFFIFTDSVSAQRNADPGLIAGTSWYMGDINKSLPFYNASFAGGAVLRYNLNLRNSIRFSGIYHSLSGSDLDFPGNFHVEGPQDFAAKFVDLGLNFEFNWKPYQTAHRKTMASPYVFAGLGYGLKIVGDPEVSSHVTIPFGIGYKVNMGRWLSAGAEVGARRALSDRVDGVVNPGMEDVVTLMGNRDWYFFTGVFVTYKLFKFWEDCPTYD